ncbi:MAG: MFS transporter, partial [Acidimicrobiales bacterium]
TNPWTAFSVIAVAIYLTILDLYIVNIAIPAIAADFSGSDLSSLSWVLTAYAVAFSAVLVPAGKLGDLYGRRRLVGPDRMTLYNGIAPNPHLKESDRNIGLLDVAGGAMDERFCLDVHGDVHYIEEDLSLLHGSADSGAQLFMRVNFRADMDPARRPRLERFCFGVFMLGWQPGGSYFDTGGGYTAGHLHDPAGVVLVNLGAPTGPFNRQGDLAERRFEHGRVYVNLGSTPVEVMLPVPLEELGGGGVLTSQGAGSVISVAAADAAFLLDPGFAGTG